jgi:glycosyltransferase involved in cell wall biosynthesis
MTKRNVEVLLATFNGEKYLEEQLDSLLAQKGVKVSLLVSDDGSKDRTLEILNSYRNSFTKFKILKGPKKGPQANFFYLISQSKSEYVALCDQDDIWEPDHLKNSLQRVTPGKPGVTFSAVTEFYTAQNRKQKVWPKKIRIARIENILFENPARGCTIVMNRPFIEILLRKLPRQAIMHDWWIALVGMSYECLTATAIPEVRYRIHENNAVGPTPSIKIKLKRLLKIIRSGSLLTIDQIRNLHAIHFEYIDELMLHALTSWTLPTQTNSLKKQVLAACRYRSNFVEEVILRGNLILVWIKIYRRR